MYNTLQPTGESPNLILEKHNVCSLAYQNRIYKTQKREDMQLTLKKKKSSIMLRISKPKWKLFYSYQWYYKVSSIYILNALILTIRALFSTVNTFPVPEN